MGSVTRLCDRCQVTRVSDTRTECRACADDSAKHKGLEWQVRKFLEDHEDLKNFTYTDTALPCSAQNSSNTRRADFTYVLHDRVVFLEVDESEHRYNSPECEKKREQQLADSVTDDRYVVIVRYNPIAKRVLFMQHLEKLKTVLREAFVTDDVRFAIDGIHKVCVGYCATTVRKLDAAYEDSQKRALKRAREGDHAEEETSSLIAASKKLEREIEAMQNALKIKKSLLADVLVRGVETHTLPKKRVYKKRPLADTQLYDGDQKIPRRLIYEEIRSITYEEANRITSLCSERQATLEQKQGVEKNKYCHDKYLRSVRSTEIQAGVYNKIYIHPQLKAKLRNVRFQNMDKGRYEAIDLDDRNRHGDACLSHRDAERLRMMDNIVRVIVGTEIGPTDERSYMLTEGTLIDKERLESAVDFVHSKKQYLFSLFRMHFISNRKETNNIGFKLQTLNAVLLVWGFTKIASKRKRIKGVSHQEYHVCSNIPAMPLSDIYSKVKGDQHGDAPDKEALADYS
jgi:hypothetical protein